MSPFDRALVLTGPTACGKSAIALEVAERARAEIIALDSMTVYRGMDIGTAKPSAADRQRIPHHLIDVLDPWESLTVAWWLERARAISSEILARGKRPLFVGGTPFYLKALLHGLFPGPPADEALRRALEAEASRDGNDSLHARLAAIDPRTAARLHPNDVRRVVRALEVHALTGRPISEWQSSWDSASFVSSGDAAWPRPRPAAVVLDVPREELYRRINERVDAMMAAGWLDEVRALSRLPQPISREARQALGYRELLDHLDGNGSGLEETVDLIRTHTRQFAKRQWTWFRHLPELVTVPRNDEDVAERVLRAWKQSSAWGEIDTLS